MFEDLKRRGLRGVELVVSDGHSGIVSAVKRSFLGASWQMCHTHFIRNVFMIERINKEIKRRSKVAEAFPSEESLLRVAVAILIDINEERFLSRRYLSIDYQAVWGCRTILQHFLDTTLKLIWIVLKAVIYLT